MNDVADLTASTQRHAEGGSPLHERVAGAIAAAIAAGTWKPGERLPPHRELAKRFGVAIGTITKAVETLSRRGILRSEVGRGTFVEAGDGALAAVLLPGAVPDAVVDLSINAPPPLVSAEQFKAATARAVQQVLDLPGSGYADLTGTEEQRRTMAGWLRNRPLVADPAALILCVGAQQGLALSFADLRPASAAVATEAATFPGAIAAARAVGMDLLPVPHDEEGMIPDALDRVLHKSGCRAVYTTPVCQNPLGIEAGLSRRQEILKVCERRDAFLVEDDIYGLYAKKTEATYATLAAHRTYYVTSLSKALTPLVRVGVLIPPPSRREAMAERLRAQIWGAPPLALAVGCALIEMELDGPARTLLRQEARTRIALAREVLGDVPGLSPAPMPEGAPHLWLPMPLLEAERFARRAGERGVRLTPPDSMLIEGTDAPEVAVAGVRLCLMAVASRARVEDALRRLAELRSAPAETVV